MSDMNVFASHPGVFHDLAPDRIPACALLAPHRVRDNAA
ncbi:hypothetical protein TI01_0393 [Lysobacter sp. A03]|nr:hypothetical protein TI01_0393 [Lysobacter sp. A03]